jgi:hypothetical protein
MITLTAFFSTGHDLSTEIGRARAMVARADADIFEQQAKRYDDKTNPSFTVKRTENDYEITIEISIPDDPQAASYTIEDAACRLEIRCETDEEYNFVRWVDNCPEHNAYDPQGRTAANRRSEQRERDMDEFTEAAENSLLMPSHPERDA